MRMKREIEALDAKSATIEFPKVVSFKFDYFRENLRTVLADNGLGHDWDWDPLSERFYTTWVAPSGGPLGQVSMALSTHVDLDPRKDIGGEIERLLTAQAAFFETCAQIRTMATWLTDGVLTLAEARSLAARAASKVVE